MQGFLTFLFDAVLLSSSTYVGVGFVLGLRKLWYQSHPDVVALKEKANQRIALPAATAPVMSKSMEIKDLRELEPAVVEDAKAKPGR